MEESSSFFLCELLSNEVFKTINGENVENLEPVQSRNSASKRKATPSMLIEASQSKSNVNDQET